MEAKSKNKSVKRFGSRYGRRVRAMVGKIETEQRKHHKCQYCSKVAVKRISFGIWQCEKCGAKFTGRAYTPKLLEVTAERMTGKKAEISTATAIVAEEVEA